LTSSLLRALGLEEVSTLVPRVYAPGLGIPEIAALAPLVIQAAKEGDSIAQRISQMAARYLARTLQAVVRALQMEETPFEAVLAGGILDGQGAIWRAVVEQLREIAPRARAIPPRHDAAYGAALLAQGIGE
jgi:N-acetylglucosamine kinase